MTRESVPAARRLADIDWSRWCAVDRATLAFVVHDDEILLIRKKRGLGRGKINGPGGKLEPGESVLECALRETREEVGVTPVGAELRGELRFQFADGYSIHVFVFLATRHTGTAVETDEAIPLWTPIRSIPYTEMWADDELWLPMLLAGQRFDGRFIFDGDVMLDQKLVAVDAPDTRTGGFG